MEKKGDQFEETKKNPENDPSKPSSETVSYPKIDPKDGFVSPPLVTTSTKEVEDKLEEVSIGSETPTPRNSDTPKAPKSVTWSADLTREAPPPHSPSVSEPSSATSLPREPNPYVTSAQPASPSAASSVKHSMNVAKETLGRWGKKMGETTRKAEDLAGNVWQHLKTGPSVADAAMGRIAQGTKVLAEGGYEKIFRHTFETTPEEQLQRWFACYLSTSAGPVMGILYLSTEKLAFCSDNPLSYTVGEQTEWSYYKVIIPLHQLKSVNPSTSHVKREKYIQVISVDNHEFWFVAFVNYDGAVKCLQEALHNHNI